MRSANVAGGEDFQRAVAEAKARHNLSDIVGRHTRLKRRSPAELVGLCPFHQERSASFEVNDSKGLYHCHGCGAGGDAITFLMQREGRSFRQAVEILNGGDFPIVDQAERAKRKSADAAEVQERIAVAREIWGCARPIRGTPAEVYLHSRGITTTPPETIQFVETARWRDRSTGEVGPSLPAVACAIQNCADDVVGVQCIFLDHGGLAKYERGRADGSRTKAKLSFGILSGAALRLGPVAESIVLCEGPEDGLTLMQMLPGRSVWVSCGTAGLSRVELPDAVQAVTLAGDNNLAGRNAVATAYAVFDAAGKRVAEVFPDPAFADWNDQLRGIRK